ncbi:MAG: pyridoxamine 5'-phosphate oxidase [Bacteroidetes bacterium]|nr:pyridoxamine 5'-phosphate oxidase [Rhodothermia bacterium]MCS7154814.1 pyridoxamine 5'-phosphate oxidase [Bacteroidota bacterium]MCX7907029.1 pyridoxamine 5'-phosphate oxidase [Bacteroidota bacterium]MDW8137607.1 pyridoxamine 5'-phosphate oxidase [Bacteroidota bacterium]MDW8285439.1 pyridoxamine 5'-phosphate oxidase [Bacteroidota bacterium]
MTLALEQLRREYRQAALEEDKLDPDPIRQLERWLEEAIRARVPEPNAMALATATPEGRPSVRMVLLKGLDARGLVFYTNLESRKARELFQNPWAALLFWWPELERQVRVEGAVEPVSDEEADAYFRSRPRASRIGAWASPQSRPLESRSALLRRVIKTIARFPIGHIPRPPFWGGFRVQVQSVEFWQGRPSRLHDRILYRRNADGSWTRQRLAP